MCIAGSLAVRARPAARLLRLVGYGAWLGGHLVYGEGLGVDHAQRPDSTESFSRVLPVAELPEAEPSLAEVDGVKVVLVRRGAQVHALGDVCSHLGGPLSEGTLDGWTIRCPWHGSEFDVTDGCVRHGPATMPQPVWDVRVHDGWVELRPAG
jgi:nitrite reductase/ring-hydroxylating ferredoxin subunit